MSVATPITAVQQQTQGFIDLLISIQINSDMVLRTHTSAHQVSRACIVADMQAV